jgi:hypothetical protein
LSTDGLVCDQFALGNLLGDKPNAFCHSCHMKIDTDELVVLELVADMPEKACKPYFRVMLKGLASRGLIERDREIWKLTASGKAIVERGNATVH